MYRVLVIPTKGQPRQEEWLAAYTVRESRGGVYWEFLDGNGVVVERLKKSAVISFTPIENQRGRARPAPRFLANDA